MIDWARVCQLREDVGAEDLDDIVQIFIDEMEEAMAGLAATPPGDAGAWVERMHFLKGSAYNLGFDAFGTLCATAENAAQGGQVDAVSVDVLRQSYEDSKSVFLRDMARHLAAA